MAVVLPIFIYPDIIRMVHYVQKKVATKKAVKVRVLPPSDKSEYLNLLAPRRSSKLKIPISTGPAQGFALHDNIHDKITNCTDLL